MISARGSTKFTVSSSEKYRCEYTYCDSYITVRVNSQSVAEKNVDDATSVSVAFGIDNSGNVHSDDDDDNPDDSGMSVGEIIIIVIAVILAVSLVVYAVNRFFRKKPVVQYHNLNGQPKAQVAREGERDEVIGEPDTPVDYAGERGSDPSRNLSGAIPASFGSFDDVPK